MPWAGLRARWGLKGRELRNSEPANSARPASVQQCGQRCLAFIQGTVTNTSWPQASSSWVWGDGLLPVRFTAPQSLVQHGDFFIFLQVIGSPPQMPTRVGPGPSQLLRLPSQPPYVGTGSHHHCPPGSASAGKPAPAAPPPRTCQLSAHIPVSVVTGVKYPLCSFAQSTDT